MPTIELDSTTPIAGPWIATGSLVGVEEVRASVCDRDVGLARIHHFRAPVGGAYEFTLTAEGDSPYTRLILRTRCAIGDAGAQSATVAPGERRASMIKTLAASEEVFLFASTGDRLGYTLAATHIR